jgi:hypothetical protein
MHRRLLTSGLLCLALILSACEAVGPRALRAGRTDYNAAMKSTDAEQLLLNIVRMRYSDKPYFLTIASVSATTEVNAAIGTGGKDVTGVEGRITYLERPNIVYIPLTGEDFVTQLLSPLDLETLLLLRGGGWEMDEIFRVFADSINGVPNATNAADASLEDIPEFREFLAAVEPLDEMEDAGNLLFAASETKAESEMVVYVLKSARDSADFHTFAKNFNLDPSKGRYRVRIGLNQRSNDELVIATRPLLSAMFYLGHSIEIPDAEHASGAAHTVLGEDGLPYDWEELFTGLMSIHSAESPPSDAFTAVEYGGYWYYIENTDADSKETLTMLGIVLALKAGGSPSTGPLLTLPVTGQ